MEYNSPYATPESDITTEQEGTYQPQFLAFKGRIGRLRYLAYSMGVYFLFGLAIGIVGGLTAGSILNQSSEGLLGFSGLLVVLAIPLLVFMIVISVRRANDLDHTGWIILLSLIPFIGWIFNLYLIFARGTEGSNKYGPAPCENPLSVKILGLMLPAIVILGIGASIVIPILAR